ncbi:MAG TPA: cupin domain-containing protein [Streptosporangiaceae bacterium]|nr:cupin domain-containing protein [Streptosporangiaceae bacterium]
MQVFTADPAGLTSEHGIQIGRWEQYAGVGDTPFGAMWCVVPPGGRSSIDCHSERELWVVVRGDAEVESGDRVQAAPTGSAVLLESEEPHVMVNRSADEPLVILSVYWEPGTAAQADAG